MKGFKATEIVKEIMFDGVWVELEAKKCFQRQPFIKYLRLSLVSMLNGAPWGSLISVFQEFFDSTDKIFILTGRLGTRVSFYEV